MKFYVGLAMLLMVPELAKSVGPIVDTRLGFVEGYWQVSRVGRQYEAFVGIPYALPPVGHLRFEPPQPATAWEGRFSAENISPCVQWFPPTESAKAKTFGSEDCLYLSVYVPKRHNVTKLLPVIAYFHGGGFQVGQSDTWSADYLMDRDVVYVCPNYRVGMLGFLSTEDRVVPGNMGLKDQSLALKWISENIDSFGGDPNAVTLAGHSSGAGAVHYHYLSPMSRGLFHRGISASGTSLNCWAQTEAAAEKAKKLGALMSCPTDNMAKMVECLKTRPAKFMVQSQSKFQVSEWFYHPSTTFGPVAEKNSPNPFIDKLPMEIIRRGEMTDVPWITGAATEEGIYPVVQFLNRPDLAKYVDENWNDLAPHVLDYNYTIPITNHSRIARYIRNFYMGNELMNVEHADNVIRMVGHRLWSTAIGKAAREQARVNKSPVWFFLYGYLGEYSVSQEYSLINRRYGVGHSDDSYLIFPRSKKVLHRPDDVRMSLILINFWVTFATTGVPEMGTEWLRVNGSSDELNYLRISNPDVMFMDSDDDFGEAKFWNSIDFHENMLPSDDE